MKGRPLAELLRGLSPLGVLGPMEIRITGLCCDSRRVRPGDLFFALPGSRTDGNRFVKAALERGAAAVASALAPPPPPATLPASWIQVPDIAEAMGRIADAYFEHPSRDLTVIGVTGTNGKTTTTYLLESIIHACAGKAGVAGTINYRLGGREIEKAPNTTPISLELLRLLRRFKDGSATHVAMEVSSHALALKRVEEVEFDAAVFTNLSLDHLDFHKTPEEYFRAKAHLFELLGRASSGKKKRVAVINADDARAKALRRLAPGAEAILYGLGPSASLRAERVRADLRGTRFELVFRGTRLAARTRLPGEHNLYNALAAAGAALGLGLPEAAVLQGLSELRQVPGRLEPVEEGQGFHVFVDYAHTESALKTVLGLLKRLPAPGVAGAGVPPPLKTGRGLPAPGVLGAGVPPPLKTGRGLPQRRLITVFGCGGERDRSKRGPMGVAACRMSDLAIITSDNPRSEDPLAIIADIEARLKTEGLKNYRISPERGEAIPEAIAEAAEGDVVLIAGKGHEATQILKDRAIPFDDRQAARKALRERIARL